MTLSTKSIPTIKEFTFFFLMQLRHDRIKAFTRYHHNYGDIFHKYFNKHDHYYLRHPRYIEHVLSTNQKNYRKAKIFIDTLSPIVGESNLILNNNLKEWHFDRELTMITFDTATYFQDYIDKIVNVADHYMTHWQQNINTDQNINYDHEIDKLILDIEEDTIFTHVDLDTELMSQRIPYGLMLASQRIDPISKIKWLLFPKFKRDFDMTTQFVDKTIRDVISNRLASGKDYDDILGTFIHAYSIQNDKSDNFEKVGNKIVLMYVAAYLTTSATLAWIFAMLARHPEVQENIVDEIKNVCNDRLPTYSDFFKLPYTQATIAETQRLYPTLSMLLRDSIDADEINGCPINPDSILFLNIYLAHRHPEFWKNPDKFDPTRFLNNPFGQAHSFAYIPFGEGKRSCPAKNFSFIELCILTVMLLQRFKIVSTADFKTQIKYTSAISIRPNIDGVTLKARK